MASSSSQQVTLVANTASALHWAEWFDEVVLTNLGSTAVWVDTSGATATVGGAGLDVVLPGAVAVFPNRQAKTYWSSVGAGGDPIGIGATVQNSQNGTDLPASGYGTFVSIISSGTPQVVASPQ
jgi:hypothetical protein